MTPCDPGLRFEFGLVLSLPAFALPRFLVVSRARADLHASGGCDPRLLEHRQDTTRSMMPLASRWHNISASCRNSSGIDSSSHTPRSSSRIVAIAMR